MEKISYLPDMHRAPRLAPSPARAAEAHQVDTVTSDWRERVPVLTGSRVTLRELEIEDAPSLFSMLTTEEVSRFISRRRARSRVSSASSVGAARTRSGRFVCFAVVPQGTNTAIGIFQLRQIEAGFASGEVGLRDWLSLLGLRRVHRRGTAGCRLCLRNHRRPSARARAAVMNGRGNGALRKIGAVQEGILRRSFTKNGEQLDQVLWSILADDWRRAKVAWLSKAIH